MPTAPDLLTRHLQEMPPHRAVLRAVECRFMGKVPLTSPVLDVGCGDGHFSSLAYEGRRLEVGIDLHRPSLEEARARGNYAALAESSGEVLPFADGAFATVVSNCVIEHIPQVDLALAEIARVLRPGGLFATTVPSEHFADFLLGSTLLRKVGLRGAGTAYGRFFNRISVHHHVLTLDQWRQRMAAAGLEIVEATDYFSAAAHRRFDASHYLGVSSLLTKKWLGKWIALPVQGWAFERWLRPYFEEALPERGAYRFLLCRKPMESLP